MFDSQVLYQALQVPNVNRVIQLAKRVVVPGQKNACHVTRLGSIPVMEIAFFVQMVNTEMEIHALIAILSAKHANHIQPAYRESTVS